MSVLLYDAHGAPLISRDDPIDIPDDFDPQEPQPGVACMGCGCTDEDGCAQSGCFWVAPGLCSSCAPELADEWRGAAGWR